MAKLGKVKPVWLNVMLILGVIVLWATAVISKKGADCLN